jgi:predicted alpha/beta hydrolase family esterase
MVAELRCQEPELRILAADLPGRRSTPGDLAAATIRAWVESVVADINDAGFGEIVIVAHSMAGVTVPGVAARLGSSRVREMVLAAAFVLVRVKRSSTRSTVRWHGSPDAAPGREYR